MVARCDERCGARQGRGRSRVEDAGRPHRGALRERTGVRSCPRAWLRRDARRGARAGRTQPRRRAAACKPARACPSSRSRISSELLERLERGSVAFGPGARGAPSHARRARRRCARSSRFTARSTLALATALATDRGSIRLSDEIAGAIDEDGNVLDRASPELARARVRRSPKHGASSPHACPSS